MTRLRSILTSSLLTLVLGLVIVTMGLVMSEMQSVQADAINEPVAVTIEERAEYLPLTDAVPQRDVTNQEFAPSVMTQ